MAKTSRKPKSKRKIAVIFAIILLSGIVGLLIAGQIALRNPQSTVITDVTPEKPMLQQINRVRTEIGKPALTQDPKLDQAAFEKVSDQIDRHYWLHHLPGEDTRHFLIDKYPGKRVGENLAKCQTSDANRVRDWVNSPTHYAVMTGDFDAMGYAEKVNPADHNCVYTVMYFIKY